MRVLNVLDGDRKLKVLISMRTYDPSLKHYTIIEEVDIGCNEDGDYHVYSGDNIDEALFEVKSISEGAEHQKVYIEFVKAMLGVQEDRELNEMFKLLCSLENKEDICKVQFHIDKKFGMPVKNK